MPYTTTTDRIVRLVRLRPGVSDDEALVNRIQTLIAPKCETLALKIFRTSPAERVYIQRRAGDPFVVAFVAGVASLTALIGSILVESVPGATLLHEDAETYPEPLDYVPDRRDLLETWRPPETVLYTIEGDQLLARDFPAEDTIAGTPALELTTFAGNVTINGACFIPQVGADATQTTLEDRLENNLVALIAEALGAMSDPEETEGV